MTDVSQTGGQLLDQAAEVLHNTRALIDKALSTLKANTVEDGRLSNARLDEYQLVSYELSLCWAECCAAGFMLDHASSCQDDFTSRLCALFCAEQPPNTTPIATIRTITNNFLSMAIKMPPLLNSLII